MELQNMHVGCFYAIDTEPRIAQRAHFPVGSIHQVQVVDRGEGTVVIRVPALQEDVRILPRRFRLAHITEVFKRGTRVKITKDENRRYLVGDPGWVPDIMGGLAEDEEVFAISEVNVEGRQTWVRLEGDPDQFIFDMRWLEVFGDVPHNLQQQVYSENAPAQPQAAFKAGDIVELIDRNKHPDWQGPMVFQKVNANGHALARHPEWGDGAFKVEDLQLVGAKPPAPKVAFKMGDLVTIAKKVEKAGLHWPELMNRTVGKAGKITATKEVKGFTVFKVGLWWYPAESLALYKKPIKKPTVRELVIQTRKKGLEPKDLSTSSYAIIATNNFGELEVFNHLRDVCHYRIQSNKRWTKVHAIIDFVQDVKFGKVDKPLIPWAKKYADYIVNRSPFSIAFKKKQGRSVVDNGADINVSAPLSIVAAGLISLRLMREWSRSLYLFKHLVSNGVSEHAAYILMHGIAVSHKGTFTRTEGFGGHQCISSVQPLKSIISLFAKGYHPDALKGTPVSNAQEYYRVTENIDKWGSDGQIIGTWLANNIKQEVVGKGFDAQRCVTKEEAIRVGKLLDQLIEEAKV